LIKPALSLSRAKLGIFGHFRININSVMSALKGFFSVLWFSIDSACKEVGAEEGARIFGALE